MIDVKIKRLSDTATMPTYGSTYAAGLDLYADSDAIIYPKETVKIGCGFAFEPPEGYAGFIYARSGLATKQGLRPANCVGVADEDYKGEYIVPLHNDSRDIQRVNRGDRIAQLIFMPYEQAILKEVDELTPTQRGTGGFGSTGR